MACAVMVMVMVMVILLLNTVLLSAFSYLTLGHQQDDEGVGGTELGRRVLMSFKETPNGRNLTFECSPSGPCLPCLYSEKKDDKYRCSETGYRIPLKCVKIGADSKETDNKRMQGRSTLDTANENVKVNVKSRDAEEFSASITHRSLLDDSSMSEGESEAYITYRSCIPAVNEEKMSVLGFEGIMLCLLVISGSFIYFKRKVTVAVSGAVRVPTNSRF